MARAKKSRKGGPIGVAKTSNESSPKVKKSPPPPRSKKKKGNSPGSRHSETTTKKVVSSSTGSTDKRIGSKKPIPLIVESKKPQSQIKKRKFATPAQELAALEADSRFNRLLDKLDDEQVLNSEDQQWLDAQLARHRVLCDLLGIKDETEEQDDAGDPFAQLDAIRMDDFEN